MFQVFFHHVFLELVTDIAKHVNSNQEYAVEFGVEGVLLLVFIQSWRNDQLCRVFLKRTSRLQGQTSAEICLKSYFKGVLSTSPSLRSCTGCSARFIQFIDQSPCSDFGVQSPPRFDDLHDLQQLMHKKTSSVFGRIDFFSVLKYLIISLGGCLELDWVLLSPELFKVGKVFSSRQPT